MGNSALTDPALARAFAYSGTYRDRPRTLDAVASPQELRARFCSPTPETGRNTVDVINDLIAAAEPGLIGNTQNNFFGWVMGGSDISGVAADWLTSVWGQNSAIYQTAPSAAIAEEAVSAWLLDLLDLPQQSSVGFVTGATMAGFVSLAAARTDVLRRMGHNWEETGLQGAPLIRVFLSDDAHISNLAALRYLGFGEANLIRIASNKQGVMQTGALADAMAANEGPKIIIGTAGQINSGGFEDFTQLADLAEAHDAWLHVDGAFGLWARLLPEKAHLTRGLERADSWSVDGHKWLQVPYDSGFAIVKNPDAHRRAMDISASYLNHEPGDGRNPTEYNPELSRRARGFAAWAVIQSLGRSGIRDMVARHCAAATLLADCLRDEPGIEILHRVDLNQVTMVFDLNGDNMTEAVAGLINENGKGFVRTTHWKDKCALRVSIISKDAEQTTGDEFANSVAELWREFRESRPTGIQASIRQT